MPLVQLNTPVYFPPTSGIPNTNPGNSTQAINTIGFKAAAIFQSPVTDTITHIAFRTASINAGTLNVRVETMSTSTGAPSGSLWAANTSGARVMLSTDDNQYFEVALTAAASVNRGDYVCLVVEAATTSVGTIAYGSASGGAFQGYMPIAMTNAGSWVFQVAVSPAILPKFGTAGYRYLRDFYSAETVTTTTFNNTSTPDVVGNKITVPVNCVVNAGWICMDIDGDADLKLFDTDGSTLLGSASIQTNVPGVTAGSKTTIDFETEIALVAGQVVYLVVEPNTSTNTSIYRLDFDSVDHKNVWCGQATAVTAKDPTDASDYTETAAQAYCCGLIISEINTGLATTLHPIEQGISA